MWRVAGPSEYLAITGGSIKDVKLAKKAWIWPTQKCVKFHVSPVNYTFEVLPFFFSVVFTIGPCVTDHESLLLYAKLIASHIKPSVHVNNLIQHLIKGQMLTASMTTEKVLEKVLEKLQLKLKQFGLVIYKVNRLDASQTKMKGKVGAGQTKEKAVKFDLETKDKMKGKVGAGQTQKKAVRFDLEMKGKVGAGQTKEKAVKFDLETKDKMMKGKVGAGQTKQNAAKTDLETKIIATERLKMEIKVTWTVKIFKNQDAWSQSYELAKVQEAYARRQEDEGIQALAQAQGMYLAAHLKQSGLFYGAIRDYQMINSGMFPWVANQRRSFLTIFCILPILCTLSFIYIIFNHVAYI
ncbi:flotillin-like protein 1 [Syzygium oleosum]|uniref:flotillin-like protein 1 n=1 Tax=Syzygium oleosum TaxID=219896 RepID=UPI0024B97231|nr:flotillin-like protein 1 [Syzygium oleosum]